MAGLVIALVLGAGGEAGAVSSCLPLGEPVSLTGAVREIAFPGPPNYENSENGDRLESSWFLVLRQPVCVAAPDRIWDKFGQDFSRILIVQLLSHGNQKALKARANSDATVSGSLFVQVTGHHRTAVLLDISHIASP